MDFTEKSSEIREIKMGIMNKLTLEFDVSARRRLIHGRRVIALFLARLSKKLVGECARKQQAGTKGMSDVVSPLFATAVTQYHHDCRYKTSPLYSSSPVRDLRRCPKNMRKPQGGKQASVCVRTHDRYMCTHEGKKEPHQIRQVHHDRLSLVVRCGTRTFTWERRLRSPPISCRGGCGTQGRRSCRRSRRSRNRTAGGPPERAAVSGGRGGKQGYVSYTA